MYKRQPQWAPDLLDDKEKDTNCTIVGYGIEDIRGGFLLLNDGEYGEMVSCMPQGWLIQEDAELLPGYPGESLKYAPFFLALTQEGRQQEYAHDVFTGEECVPLYIVDEADIGLALCLWFTLAKLIAMEDYEDSEYDSRTLEDYLKDIDRQHKQLLRNTMIHFGVHPYFHDFTEIQPRI